MANKSRYINRSHSYYYFIFLLFTSGAYWVTYISGTLFFGNGGGLLGSLLGGYLYRQFGKKEFAKELDEMGITQLKMGGDLNSLGWSCSVDIKDNAYDFLSNPAFVLHHKFSSEKYADLFYDANKDQLAY